MSIPDDYKSVSTNLPLSQLEIVLKAIDEKRVIWDQTKTSLVVEYCYGEFDFEGSRYCHEEFEGLTCSVILKSGKPEFVKKLIQELEEKPTAVIRNKKYTETQSVNFKIESLKRQFES